MAEIIALEAQPRTVTGKKVKQLRNMQLIPAVIYGQKLEQAVPIQVPVDALRAVLHQGIERLRPAGERTYTSNTWLVYNILELRYVQGKQIREVADRLAMSESDFYRKQRGAIQQLAAALVTMEGEQVEAEKAAEGPDKRV